MTRKEFDNLDEKEQISFINEKLNSGLTITKICNEIGIARSTVRNRFEKNNYVFDKNSNNYICNEKVIINEIAVAQSDELQMYDKSNNYNSIAKVISEFQEVKKQLSEVYEWYSKEKNIVDIEPIELNIKEFEGDPVNRTYKIYPKIHKEFKEFCNNNKKYKVQDIISMALHEFIEKYKK